MGSFGCKTGYTKDCMPRELASYNSGYICESLQTELELQDELGRPPSMKATLSMKTSVD